MIDSPHEPLPRWPQFSLRTLLFAVAICGVIAAIMGKLGPVWSVALAWFLFLAAVHVCGNFWGHQLRHHHRHLHPDDGPPNPAAPHRSAHTTSAPSTRLRTSAQLGPTMIVASAVGALLAGMIAALALILLAWDEAGYAGVVVGGCSAAVIGGLIGFLASSFLAVFLAAWGQASSELYPIEPNEAGESR